MHAEAYRIPPETLDALSAVRGRRPAGGCWPWAPPWCGRSSRGPRAAASPGAPTCSSGAASSSRVVDRLLTNFHVPRSSLLVLVDAFVGPRWRQLYEEALAGGYRFLSLGDAMLLERLRVGRPRPVSGPLRLTIDAVEGGARAGDRAHRPGQRSAPRRSCRSAPGGRCARSTPPTSRRSAPRSCWATPTTSCCGPVPTSWPTWAACTASPAGPGTCSPTRAATRSSRSGPRSTRTAPRSRRPTTAARHRLTPGVGRGRPGPAGRRHPDGPRRLPRPARPPPTWWRPRPSGRIVGPSGPGGRSSPTAGVPAPPGAVRHRPGRRRRGDLRARSRPHARRPRLRRLRHRRAVGGGDQGRDGPGAGRRHRRAAGRAARAT